MSPVSSSQQEARRSIGHVSPGLLMLVSAGLWGCVPVLFTLGSIGGTSPWLVAVLVNGLGGAGCLAVFLLRAAADAATVRPLDVLRYLRSRRSRATVLVDGLALGVSDLALIAALTYPNRAGVAIVAESWPLVAFLLFMRIGRMSAVSRSQWFWSALGVVGFYIVVFSLGGPLDSDFSLPALALAVVAAVGNGVTAPYHQRVLDGFSSDISVEKNLAFQGIRMLLGSAVAVPFGVVLASSGGLTLDTDAILPISCVALISLLSSLLFARAMETTSTVATTLGWFVTPVWSVALLAAFGFSDVPTNLVVGAVLVIGANAFLQERLEATVNVAMLISAAVASGTLVLYLPGWELANYFEYVTVVTAFYGILQGFLISRLWERKLRIDVLRGDIEVREALDLTRFEGSLEHALRDEEILRGQTELSILRSELGAYSEAVLLSLVGAASIVILVVGRPQEVMADVVAFLIPVAIAFLLGLTWTLIVKSSRPAAAWRETVRDQGVLTLDGSRSVRRDDAVFGYVLVVLIFAVYCGAILSIAQTTGGA